MFWRVIYENPYGAFFNMALDEAISEAVRKKLSPPTLRLYQWAKPSITIGCFQKISDINLDYCRRKNYPIVRRATGGKATLHDSELTYSFSACTNNGLFKKRLLENYLAISNTLVLALKFINLDAEIILSKNRRRRSPLCFKISSYGEITISGEKIIGSAQKQFINGFLQQGSILIDTDVIELRKVIGQYNTEEEFYRIGTIKKYAPTISVEELGKTIKEAFEKTFKIRLISGAPTEFELNLAKRLEADKYSSQKWNFSR